MRASAPATAAASKPAAHTYTLPESLSKILTLSPKPPALVADSGSAYTAKRIVLTSLRNWCSVL
jgi:hypothetical protein